MHANYEFVCISLHYRIQAKVAIGDIRPAYYGIYIYPGRTSIDLIFVVIFSHLTRSNRCPRDSNSGICLFVYSTSLSNPLRIFHRNYTLPPPPPGAPSPISIHSSIPHSSSIYAAYPAPANPIQSHPAAPQLPKTNLTYPPRPLCLAYTRPTPSTSTETQITMRYLPVFRTLLTMPYVHW